MVAALLLLVVFAAAVWLIFFKLKLLKFSITWGVVCALFGIHILLIFLIGLRFSTPYSTDARVIQHTIQLIPRLPEPTLVTAVLVQPDVPVKKGDPLFQFDRRPYEYQVRQMEGALAAAKEGMAGAEYKIKQLQAGLVAAKQDVLVRKVDVEAADAKVNRVKSEAEYARYQYRLYNGLAEQGAGPKEESEKWSAQVKVQEASVKEAEADAKRSKLIYESEINGVNTNVIKAVAELKEEDAAVKQAEATVASVSGQLALARYYLENTTMMAPEDGHIVNLQVVPGMVSGIVRFGAIASFIVDKDSYVLANFFQEHLKYVKAGQRVEVALNRYPGQIFQGKVESVWWANGEGQLLPTGDLPVFNPGPNSAQTGFAVKIAMENKDQGLFPIGAQGAAAIYTSNGGFAAMRRVVIRTYSWFNFLYPMPSG
jgi:multidrug resistance efflux pump